MTGLFQAIPLMQTIPYSGPARYAVFADEQGNPKFEPLVAMGTCQFNPERDGRTMVGFTVGDHIEAADVKAHFVGWEIRDVFQEAGNPDDSPYAFAMDKWLPACKAKRAELVANAKEKTAQKIVIPNQQGIVQAIKLP